MKTYINIFLAVTLLAGATVGAFPAAAQTIAAERPASVLHVLKSLGLPGEIKNQPNGAPYISSTHDNMPFVIAMMNCNDQNEVCKTMQFYFGFNDRKGFSLEHINSWNSGKRFVRAYRDSEDDPVLVMDVDTDKGGIPDAVFRENLDVWLNQMQNFRRFVLDQD